MFTLPRPRRALPWQEQLSVRKWLAQIFALNSRKSNYHVTVGKSPHFAWVNPEARRVYVTQDLPAVPPDHVRFDPVDAHRRTEMLLTGFLAHEAAHVRFSGPKPAGKLGEIWNALEDERIERLISGECPELRPVFTFLGDVVSELERTGESGWSYTAMEGVLQWRFEHDRHLPRWQPRAEDQAIWHAEIRPRVEQAWRAENTREVTALAGEIMTLLRGHQEALEDAAPPQPQPAAPPEAPAGPPQSGPEQGSPEEQGPGSGPSPETQGEQTPTTDSDQPSADQPGAEQPDADQSSQNADAGTQEEGDTDGAGESSQESGENADGQTSGEAEDAAGSPGGEGGEENSPGEGSQPEGTEPAGANPQDGAGESGGLDDAASDSGASEGASADPAGDTGPPGAEAGAEGENAGAPGPDQGTPGTTGPGPGTGPGTGPQSRVSPEEQAAENGDDRHLPRTWAGVSATGADADERDGDAQARREAEQAGEASPEPAADPQARTSAQHDPDATPGPVPPDARPEQDTQTPAPALGHASSGVGDASSALPAMPEPDPGSGSLIADGVEGHARKLAPLLKPPERPGRTRPHRSKGRFDARRDARDAERVFLRKAVASKPTPIRVRLLIDVSGSMTGAPIECARAAASMIVRAAALSGSCAEVHLFNTGHQPVITQPMGYAEAQALVADIQVDGGTRLAPALMALTNTPPHPLESELIVVVCDGQLTMSDYNECGVIVKRGQAVGKRYLPVLISQAASFHGTWREIFGSALPCESATDLALNIKAALTSLRSHLGG